jgi:hypothetical protein
MIEGSGSGSISLTNGSGSATLPIGLVFYSVNKPTYKYVIHLEVGLLAGGLIVELHECVLQGVTRLLVPNHLAVLHLPKPEMKIIKNKSS